MMTLLLLLTGCGGGSTDNTTRETQLRGHYAALTAFSGQAQVTADYGSQVYQYEISVSGNLLSGTLEVSAPESIAGTGFSWADGGGTVSYEDVSLETGDLSPDGLSPADAMPVILTALTSGRQISAGEEYLGEERTVFLELANPNDAGGDSVVSVWLAAEDGALRRAEISWEGTTVITLVFSDFTYTWQEEQATEG